ncbi:hypothetical protein QJS10_CPA06g00306 [Acorus calamus]|uniref:GMPS ATP-PPase domain-containing protein n=1 Tax=Acorus calamus TaxID=4465 RepID=A0AAV9EM07_ACOCL|nr:hypothetical protein QJS10_CPA06g00306 [Acorus calamus]
MSTPGSGRTHSHIIKSHHNVGGLPKDMKLKLIEPLKLLFKDEADEIFVQAIKEAGIYDSIWQAFGVFLPVLTVGVQVIDFSGTSLTISPGKYAIMSEV